MKIEKIEDGAFRCWMEEEYLKRYDLNLSVFRNREPFRDKIIDDLLDSIETDYGVKFGKDTVPTEIIVYGDMLIMEFWKTPKVINFMAYLPEDELIARGIQEVFRTLPDEKIYTELMDVEEKHKMLEQIRNDEERRFIWENYM